MLNLTPYILLAAAGGLRRARTLRARAAAQWPSRWSAAGWCWSPSCWRVVAFHLRCSACAPDAAYLGGARSGRGSPPARLDIPFGLLLDPLSAIMLLIVTGVGFLIHVYSIGYMADDPGYWRFFAFLNLFVFAMALLVTADNFLFLLIGWAGVGLASFLLIGFWYTRPSAVAAARKAFVVNVIGDFGLMIAIFLIFGASAR